MGSARTLALCAVVILAVVESPGRSSLLGASSVAQLEQNVVALDRLDFTPQEERLLATHEAGHAVVSLFCRHSRTIARDPRAVPLRELTTGTTLRPPVLCAGQ